MLEPTPIEEATLIHLRKKVMPSLQLRLVLYFAIAIIGLGIAIYHVTVDHTGIALPLLGFAAGIALGFGFSRIHTISWDKDERKVVASLDIVGVLMLILYILFALNREEVVAYFIHGPAVLAVAFALLSGTMLGRTIATHGKIRKVFEEKRIIK